MRKSGSKIIDTGGTTPRKETDGMNHKKILFDSYTYGTMAFKSGLKRIPVNDKTFVDEVIAKGSGVVGESIPYLKAWIRGWDDANLYGTN